jgi:glycosyltransferase involved in cell wall biosynthesis
VARRHQPKPIPTHKGSDGSVTLAYVHGLSVSESWQASIQGLLFHDLTNAQRVIRGGFAKVRYGSGGIVDARNAGVKAFLDQYPAEWLLWIDTDMGFDADAVDRLVEAADPVERPIVGGLAFMLKEIGQDGRHGFKSIPAPTVFHWHQNPDGTAGFVADFAYPKDTLVECSATGSAFILIHRSVLEKMREVHGDTWYSQVRNTDNGDELLSEDLSFCARAKMMDYKVHVHTGVRTSHLKEQHVDERVFDIYVAGVEALGAMPT